MLGWAVFLHFVGDYITQSHWMANEKTKKWFPAVAHGVIYSLPFLFLTQSVLALAVIGGTHIVIDHYRLARHFIWAKNMVLSPLSVRTPWVEARAHQGFDTSTPLWLSTILMIVVDNIMHVSINILALLYL